MDDWSLMEEGAGVNLGFGEVRNLALMASSLAGRGYRYEQSFPRVVYRDRTFAPGVTRRLYETTQLWHNMSVKEVFAPARRGIA